MARCERLGERSARRVARRPRRKRAQRDGGERNARQRRPRAFAHGLALLLRAPAAAHGQQKVRDAQPLLPLHAARRSQPCRSARARARAAHTSRHTAGRCPSWGPAPASRGRLSAQPDLLAPDLSPRLRGSRVCGTKKKKRKKENELAPSRQSAGQVACRAGSGGRPPPRRCRRTF